MRRSAAATRSNVAGCGPPAMGASGHGPRLRRRGFIRGLALSVAGIIAAPLIVACGFQQVENQYTVGMTDESGYDIPTKRGFQPSRITVPKGAQVIWSNEGTHPHSATDDAALAKNKSDAVLPRGAQAWNSGTLYPGETWTYTFNVPGQYTYFCQYDELKGMIGTVIVTG